MRYALIYMPTIHTLLTMQPLQAMFTFHMLHAAKIYAPISADAIFAAAPVTPCRSGHFFDGYYFLLMRCRRQRRQGAARWARAWRDEHIILYKARYAAR